MVDLSLAANFGQIVIFVGAFLGNFVVTMIPFWKEKTRFGDYDLTIIFDHKFLATALVAGIASVVTVSAAYNNIAAQVDPSSTAFLAFLSAALLGGAINKGLNMLLPTPNVEQKAQLAVLQREEIIEDYEHEKKLQSIVDVETQNSGNQNLQNNQTGTKA